MNTNNSQNILLKIILRELYLNKINKKINKSINLINKLDYDLISTFNLKGGGKLDELLSNIKNFKTELEEVSEKRNTLSNRISELIKVIPTAEINLETVRKSLDQLTKDREIFSREKAEIEQQINEIDKETKEIYDVVHKIDVSNMLTIFSAILEIGKFEYQDLRILFFEFANLKFPLKKELIDTIMVWFIEYFKKYNEENENKKELFYKLLYYGLSFTTLTSNIIKFLTKEWDDNTTIEYKENNNFQNLESFDIKKIISELPTR